VFDDRFFCKTSDSCYYYIKIAIQKHVPIISMNGANPIPFFGQLTGR